VALDAGYGSHEAFTRAFRQHFGLTPEQVRAQACLENPNLQEPIRMEETTTLTLSLSAPRIVDGKAMQIFGLSEKCGCDSNAAIPSQWGRFLQYFGHIQNQVGRVA